jgi:hypothetical protein
MILKKLTVLLMFVSMLLPSVVSADEVVQEQSPVRVYFEGQLMQFNVAPVIENGVTLVQFRPIFERLGLEVNWDGATKKVTGKNTKLQVEMYLNSQSVAVNGVQRSLDLAPKLIDGNTMIPLRFVSEVSGKEVVWNEQYRTIDINSGYEKDDTVSPYAVDSFLKLDDIQANVGMQYKLHQSGDSLYVLWTKEESFNSGSTVIQGTRFYMSLAKDGKWIKQGVQIYWKQRVEGLKYEILYADGSYYIKDDYSIVKVTPNDSYSPLVTTVTNNLPHLVGQPDTWRVTYVDGKIGFLYKTTTVTGGVYSVSTPYTRIYYEGVNTSSNFYTVKDVYKVLDDPNQGGTLVFNSYSNTLYLIQGEGYRQLNTVTGDLTYGLDGKDAVTKFDDTSRQSSTKLIYSNGKMSLLYMRGQETTYRLAALEPNMLVGTGIFTSMPPEELNGKEIYSDGKKLTLLSVYEFSRKPAIQLDTYTNRK